MCVSAASHSLALSNCQLIDSFHGLHLVYYSAPVRLTQSQKGIVTKNFCWPESSAHNTVTCGLHFIMNIHWNASSYVTNLLLVHCNTTIMVDWVRFNVSLHTLQVIVETMFLQVSWPNQQCQSTEGRWLAIETGLSLTRLALACNNKQHACTYNTTKWNKRN